jgi:hypothetical protein
MGKKTIKDSKRINKRKTQKSRKNKRKRGGNCGCGKNLFSGGSAFGPASFDGNVPIHAYYPYNTEAGSASDPITPGNITDARLTDNILFNPLSTQKGGKRTRKSNRRIRFRRGGASSLNPLLINGQDNQINQFGTSSIGGLAQHYSSNMPIQSNLSSIHDFQQAYKPLV